MTLNKVKINLPVPVIALLKDKYKGRRILKWDPLLFHIILEQEYGMFLFNVRGSY